MRIGVWRYSENGEREKKGREMHRQKGGGGRGEREGVEVSTNR